jgi:alkanesulfonate monooxygenase SsuD/methylene tetrahydromethanopterin reductase-like flavin-dependent oxidoreductase (luciferase family)
MQFGILFTSQPNPDEEPYPHRATNARVTEHVLLAERAGYDVAWIAEHHFNTHTGSELVTDGGMTATSCEHNPARPQYQAA